MTAGTPLLLTVNPSRLTSMTNDTRPPKHRPSKVVARQVDCADSCEREQEAKPVRYIQSIKSRRTKKWTTGIVQRMIAKI